MRTKAFSSGFFYSKTMNFKQGDIIIRKTEAGEQTLWLSERLVIEVCCQKEEYFWVARIRYKKNIRPCDLAKAKEFMPDSGKSWRWAKTQGQFYYCLSNIPNRAPQNYRARFGDAQTLLTQYEQAMAERKETNLETVFKQHLNKTYPQYLEYYTKVDVTRRVALAKACAVLDFCLDNLDTYGGTENALYKDLSPILSKMELQYIPHNYQRLKEKIEILRTTDHCIVDLIDLPRTGNKNAEQYTDQEVFSWVMQLRAMGLNDSNEFIIRYVWELCDRFGKEKPSRRWFGQNIFELPKTKYLTAEKRFGYGSRKAQMYSGYIPFKNAVCAGDCWEIDASRVNLIAHQTVDEKGNKAERFLFAIVVRDVHSGDILGYDIAYAENKQAYMRALRMAVEYAGYLPYSLTADRFPGHNTDEIKELFVRLEALGVQLNITHDPNGKAKVERWFGTFQSVTLMGNKYYYGEGVQSRRLSAHRSAEFLAEVKKEAKAEGFDYLKAYNEIENLIEGWRNTPYCTYSRKYANITETPKELHEKAMKNNVIDVNPARISMLFHRKKEITLKNNGLIRTEIDRAEFYYQLSVDDFDIIANYTGKKVVMTFDVLSSNTVYLWEAHGNLLVPLCEAQLFEQIQRHGPTAELGRLSEARAREKELQRRKEAELQRLTALSEDNLMLGRFTQKQTYNATEEAFLKSQESKHIALKKAVGSEYFIEDLDITKLTRTQL